MDLSNIKEELIAQVTEVIAEKSSESSGGGGLFGKIGGMVKSVSNANDAKGEVMNVLEGIMDKHDVPQSKRSGLLQELQPLIIKLATKYIAA